MNKLKLSILLGACAIMATSCEDKLDEDQKGVISMETFYTTDEDSENALIGLYDQFAQNITNAGLLGIHNATFFTYNLCGDDILAAGEFYGDNDFMATLNEFRYATDHEDLTACYKSFYRIIYAANLIINNVPEHNPNGMSTTQKRCVAEARVLRAFSHMMLAIVWNDPPKVTEVLTGNETITNCDHKELLTWCAEECAEAYNDLTERESPADKKATVKVTKGFAKFVEGKSLMFAGDFDGSKKALKEVIASGKYELVPGERMRETFHSYGEANEEVIFASNIAENTNIDAWSGMIQRSNWMYSNIMNWRLDHLALAPENVNTGWGGLGVREDYVADFLMNDNKSVEPTAERSYRVQAYFKHIDDIMYEMSYGASDSIDGRALTLDEKKADSNRGIKKSLYGQGKWLEWKRQFNTDENYTGQAFAKRNTLVARYAEVLLLYAEACARTNDNDGLQYLNEIQKRAGSKTESSELTLDAVKQEKRFEMFVEGCRWPDMVRWYQQDNDATIFDRLKDNGKHIPSLYDKYSFAKEDIGKAGNVHEFYVEYSEPNEGKQVGFTSAEKFMYFPFPFDEVNINKNIVQHPGW